MSDAVEQQVVTAAVLVIGDEILSGRTKDKNIGFIAEYLTNIGIDLKEVRVVPDEEEEIVTAVNALRARYTYLFTTGGIGPTHDDITSDSIAKAFGVAISEDDRIIQLMLERFPMAELTPARRRMARIPHGADLVLNEVSKAPGFMIGNVIVMAGVPAIMQSMMDYITPKLRTGRRMLSVSVRADAPESAVADGLRTLAEANPDVMMGSYPFNDEHGYNTNLVLRARDPDRLEAMRSALNAMLEAIPNRGPWRP